MARHEVTLAVPSTAPCVPVLTSSTATQKATSDVAFARDHPRGPSAGAEIAPNARNMRDRSPSMLEKLDPLAALRNFHAKTPLPHRILKRRLRIGLAVDQEDLPRFSPAGVGVGHEIVPIGVGTE